MSESATILPGLREVRGQRMRAFGQGVRRAALGVAGFSIFVGLWYLLSSHLGLGAFRRLPGPLDVLAEWISVDPAYGVSLFTADYYAHILASTWRAWAAFLLAVATGVPLGLLMGWRKAVRDYAGGLVGLLRPIPPLAWVPLAILLLPGTQAAVIFVTFLVAFFATVVNTVMGVLSIDRDYFRAARCLGASEWRVLRDVVLPGALPSIFTGLQVAMGAAWFSLAAGEMIAAQHGLGFLIWEAYNLIQYPTIVIGMGTLGLLGYVSSALIRLLGARLTRWRARAIGQEG
jgi:NitT/TauT family transport system permease protein